MMWYIFTKAPQSPSKLISHVILRWSHIRLCWPNIPYR